MRKLKVLSKYLRKREFGFQLVTPPTWTWNTSVASPTAPRINGQDGGWGWMSRVEELECS
ncbi:hypothetical protein QJS10_CPA16g00179 [Acorus calamus]|uniref:Uncharacterized protein n=1 Tax=Acorus calamus TaxID=4465 RepID=A0AAV9D3S2_ACOCL|nr:hypothetical protein QJS10_CPA16g00179 [Acorus calamus]